MNAYDIEEKDLPAVWVAGIRITGSYAECGSIFGKLGRTLKFRIAGKAFCLYYDEEYRETDADFEPCFPVRKPVEAEGVACRELPACRALTLLHRGPYEDLRSSYARIFAHAEERGLCILHPTREVYLKGPGMLFKGNPKKYLTEIQLPLA